LEREGPSLDQELLKPLEGGGSRFPKLSYGGQHPFSFEGLPLSEGYIEGSLQIILEYGANTAHPEVGTVIAELKALDADASAPVGVEHLRRDVKLSGRWQDREVLVGDVEAMQIEQAVLPSRVRLHLGTDVVSHGLGGPIPSFYLSIDGSLDRGPILSSKREAALVHEGVTIGFDQNTVSVIEGGAEIVKRITEHGGDVFVGGCARDGAASFQRAILVLGPETLYVVRDVSVQKDFELLDVLIGPFYFQERPGEIIARHV
jgi:hypothetical protein